MQLQQLEEKLKEIFETNYEYVRLEGGVPFTLEIKDQAWQQVLYYFRKLHPIAEKVTDTEVKLTLPNLRTPRKRKYSIEGVVDIVREEEEVWMYDIKTHDASYIKSNKEYYSQQLNVYCHIWENIRQNQLDHTAIISTVLPPQLKEAIFENNAPKEKIEFDNWEPVIPLEKNKEKVDETIQDFGGTVDKIEDKQFAPPPLDVLQTEMQGTGKKFATVVCRNCDARFSCSSFREYAKATQLRGKFNFSEYLKDIADDLDQEEWVNSNLDLNKVNEQPELPDFDNE